MRLYQIFIILLGCSLIAMRMFFSSLVNVDYLVIIIYFMLYIPIVGKYLHSAKFLGSEFRFRDEIEKAKEYVELANKKTVENNNLSKIQGENENNIESINNFESFDLSSTYKLINEDHILALASLRIEIEKKIRTVYNFMLGSENDENIQLYKMIQILDNVRFFHKEQTKALKQIISICNKAIHGINVTNLEAKEILEIAEELNISFPIGYSINIQPNHNYKDEGLICEYEHCIERMPLPVDSDKEYACPVFGHSCPGGEEYIDRCKSDRNKFNNVS